MRRQHLDIQSRSSVLLALAAITTGLLIVCATHIGSNPSVVNAQTTAQRASPLPGFVDSLKVITDLLDRGRGIEAENVARALLAQVESVRGPEALEVAEVLDLLWRAVRRSPKVEAEEKRAIVERAVAIKEKMLDPAHPDLATSLINLGVQRTLSGDPAAARPLLERAAAIRETAFGPNHVLVGSALQNLAGLLMALHDDDGAKALLERAQRIRESVYGAGHPNAVRTLVNLAIVYQETGEYIGARQRYERAFVLSEQFRSPDVLTLHVLTGVAVALSDLGGDVGRSARLNELLLALTQKAYGPTDPRLRTPLENLAMDRRDLGDYAAARELAERSLAIAEGAFSPKHTEVARSLHTLATIVAGLGDYGEAMRLFERATRINEEVLPPANPETARASWFIGDLLPLSGYGPDDVDLFERVLMIRERNRGLADPRTAESLSNLAAVLSSAEDYRRVRPLFERALESQEKFLGPDHPEVAASAINLANVLSGAGENQAAKPLYERALGSWEQSLGPDHPRVASALVNLARFHLRTGKYDDAEPLLARAQAIQEKGLGPDHPDIVVTLSSRAEVAAHTGATNEAFAIAARAEALGREHLRLTVRTLPERQALAYASALVSPLDLMLRLAATRTGDRRMSAAAWDALIHARGMVLDEMAARNRSVTGGDAKEIAGLAKALASARQRLATAVVRGPRDDPAERHRRLLDEARNEKDRAERDLAEISARFRDDQSRTRIELVELSAALPAGSALVSFVTYRGQNLEPSYLAFVLRGDERSPTVVPLGSASRIDALIGRWRRQLEQEAIASGMAAKRSDASYRRVAEELRRQIWDPLLTHLSDASRVFIVPDGAIHLVSFDALPTTATQYLVEAGRLVHYLSAERDLLPTNAGRATDGGLLALGGAAFDDRANLPSVRSDASFLGTRSACRDFQSMRFDPLPGSLKEVDQVVTLWNQVHGAESGDTITLTGAAATEAAFKAKAAGRRVLHLATHGFFLGGRCALTLDPSPAATQLGPSARVTKENPLLLSGLILAGANRRDAAAVDQEDGVLTAEEVAALNLDDVEWAVLSGCDTGVGEVRGAEGVFGLRRAFQVAGVRTVIMSLWPVEDQAARQWMSALYEGRFVKKLSTADAVRAASLAVLRQRRAKGLGTHPFYWAAFVAAGEWR